MSGELSVNVPTRDLFSLFFYVMTVGEPARTASIDILRVDGQVGPLATLDRHNTGLNERSMKIFAKKH